MDAKKRQAGQALPIMLMVLGVGSLIIGPLLGYVSVSLSNLRKGSESLDRYYAADSGSEHAIWRLAFGGLTPEEEEPFTYALSDVNGFVVDITITNKSPATEGECADNNPSSQSDRVTVGRTVDPLTASPGVPTTFSFSIRFRNIGNGTIHFSEIGFTLPQGFAYVNGSASGVTTNNPDLEDGALIWEFDPPLPSIGSGELLTQDFQAIGALAEGVYCEYCDAAWVVFQPQSIGCIVFRAGERYNVRSVAGSVWVQAAVLISGGSIAILSWDTR